MRRRPPTTDNDSGQTDTPPATFTAVATAWNHTCGLPMSDTGCLTPQA